jgi:hypothetical protein
MAVQRYQSVASAGLQRGCNAALISMVVRMYYHVGMGRTRRLMPPEQWEQQHMGGQHA